MLIIRQNATHKVVIGPVVAVGDGFTPVTTLFIGTGTPADEAEAILHDNGTVVDISGYTWAPIATADGYYHLTLQSGISGTVGHMSVVINDDSLCLPVRTDFQVIEEAAYDAMYKVDAAGPLQSTTAARKLTVSANGEGNADLTFIHGTALTETSGYLAGAFKKFFDIQTPTGTINSLPDALPSAAGGLPISDAGGLNLDAILEDTDELQGNQGAWATATSVAVSDKTGFSLANGAIVAATLGADCITAAKIADNAFVAANFAADYFTAIESECDEALSDIQLHKLMSVAVVDADDMSAEVADSSVLSLLMTTVGTTTNYDPATDSLQSIRDARTLPADAAVMVAQAATDTLRGVALHAAKILAEGLTPGGAILSENNRATVLIPPGRYRVVPVAQVDKATPGGTIEADDKFIITKDAVPISVAAGGVNVADVTAAVTAAWNLSSDPAHTPITATDDTTHITFTADTPGTAFTITATTTEANDDPADSQTFVRAAVTANRTPGIDLDTEFVDYVATQPEMGGHQMATDLDAVAGSSLDNCRASGTEIYCDTNDTTTVIQSAGNVRMRGFSITQLADTGLNCYGLDISVADNSGSVYEEMYFWHRHPDGLLPGDMAMPVGWSTDSSVAGGVWTKCIGNAMAFRCAPNGTFSATMEDCEGGSYSFIGDGAGATADDCRLVRCRAIGKYGAFESGFGSFSGCESFGMALTSTCYFEDCEAGDRSFGIGVTCAATFVRCIGGANCFGSTYIGTSIGTFSGTAINCVGGAGSFGGRGATAGANGLLTGTLSGCVAVGSLNGWRLSTSALVDDCLLQTTKNNEPCIWLEDDTSIITNSTILVVEDSGAPAIYSAAAQDVCAVGNRYNNNGTGTDGLHANVTNVGVIVSPTAAEINAEVVDALNVDTYAESTGVPAATASLVDKIGFITMLARNKQERTDVLATLYKDGGTVALATATLSDDNTTFTRTVWGDA